MTLSCCCLHHDGHVGRRDIRNNNIDRLQDIGIVILVSTTLFRFLFEAPSYMGIFFLRRVTLILEFVFTSFLISVFSYMWDFCRMRFLMYVVFLIPHFCCILVCMLDCLVSKLLLLFEDLVF